MNMQLKIVPALLIALALGLAVACEEMSNICPPGTAKDEWGACGVDAGGDTDVSIGGQDGDVVEETATTEDGDVEAEEAEEVITPMDTADLIAHERLVTSYASNVCAITVSGGLNCWGNNDNCQLGKGDNGFGGNGPYPVAGLTSGVLQVSNGQQNGCAVMEGGGIKCWGWNDNWQVGSDEAVGNFICTPLDVKYLGGPAVQVAVGHTHACALMETGGVVCWGNNGSGQRGTDESPVNPGQPVPVDGLASGVVHIAAGFDFTCAVKDDGSVLCWGDNAKFQLGNSTDVWSVTPKTVEGIDGKVVHLDIGVKSACAVTEAGAVWCWGDNERLQMGLGPEVKTRAEPNKILLNARAGAVVNGFKAVCAITSSGYFCWGDGATCLYGTADVTSSQDPLEVSALKSVTVKAGAVGSNANIVITADDQYLVWGKDSNGVMNCAPTQKTGY